MLAVPSTYPLGHYFQVHQLEFQLVAAACIPLPESFLFLFFLTTGPQFVHTNGKPELLWN